MRRNIPLHLSVNGETAEASVAPYKTLLEVLREDLDLRGSTRPQSVADRRHQDA